MVETLEPELYYKLMGTGAPQALTVPQMLTMPNPNRDRRRSKRASGLEEMLKFL